MIAGRATNALHIDIDFEESANSTEASLGRRSGRVSGSWRVIGASHLGLDRDD
jgi:hypothetical protein